jgi:hypothetical protein
MHAYILIGSVVIAATIVIHAAVMMGVLHGLRLVRAGFWHERSPVARAAVISTLVLAMFFATLLEAALWAALYVVTGAIDGAEEAMYFSMVTYSTLGYGDIVLGAEWRLLATFQAANGIMMFGWSTALIVAGVHAVYLSRITARAPDGRVDPGSG